MLQQIASTIAEKYHPTAVGDESALDSRADGRHVSQGERERWQEVLDQRLIEWGRNPEFLQDDGLKAPSSEVIAQACQFASFGRDHGVSPPQRVVPDGSGGISFEWQEKPFFLTVEIHANGDMEQLFFENSKLVRRKKLG